MAAPDPLTEFRDRWLPNATDSGLGRLIELLETGSPLLIHGAFTRAVPMGCLATHLGWHHPRTRHLDDDAGIQWLAKVAGLNPATSAVVTSWDDGGPCDRELRAGLLSASRAERDRRESASPAPRARPADAVAVAH